MEIIKTIVTVVTALGGFEGVKWLVNRKSNARVAQANADAQEIKVDTDEFRYLRERTEFAEQQLVQKEQRFAEQTSVLRDVQRQLIETTIKVGERDAEISRLQAERSIKLCERRGCANREPQSGY